MGSLLVPAWDKVCSRICLLFSFCSTILGSLSSPRRSDWRLFRPSAHSCLAFSLHPVFLPQSSPSECISPINNLSESSYRRLCFFGESDLRYLLSRLVLKKQTSKQTNKEQKQALRMGFWNWVAMETTLWVIGGIIASLQQAVWLPRSLPRWAVKMMY